MYVNVIVNIPYQKLDKTFSYFVPTGMENIIKVGDRVVVPFGRGDKLTDALVYEIVRENLDTSLKEIIYIIDKQYSFTKYQMSLLSMLRNLYASTYRRAYTTILPSAQSLVVNTNYIFKEAMFGYEKFDTVSAAKLLKLISKSKINHLLKSDKLEVSSSYSLKVKEKKSEYILPNFSSIDVVLADIPSRNKKVIRILKYVYSLKIVDYSELIKSTNSTRRDIETLIKKNYLKRDYDVEHSLDRKMLDRNTLNSSTKASAIEFSEEQRAIIRAYVDCKKQESPFRTLINGVTGSGKTEVYIELARRTIEEGKQVLILVPEIALTPQLINRIRMNLTDDIAVIHAHVSQVDKSVQYRKIKKSELKVVVGARSAAFAPFEDLGLVVIDESHESTYKSDTVPRYDVVELMMNMSLEHCFDIVLGSATSKLDHVVRAKKSGYEMLHMKKRATGATLPEVEIVDMLHSKIKLGDITETFYERLKDTFERGEKAIILHNRRGYSSYRQCVDCRTVEKCINCDVALSIENKTGKAVCRYCSYTIDSHDTCRVCSGDLRDVKPAVRSVLHDLEKLFPNEKFVAVDSLVTAKTVDYKKILDEFNAGKISALVGTQVIAKGLDFKDVTFAGVIRADMIFNSPDFTSSEKAFSLIYQLIGRAGRHKKVGRALIQTMDVDNRSLKYIADYDYYSFMSEENAIRKASVFPPYAKLYALKFTAELNVDALKVSERYYEFINKLIAEKQLKLMIYSPKPQFYMRIKNKYSYYVLIKNIGENHLKMVRILYNILVIDKYKVGSEKVNVSLDFSPSSI